MGMNMEVGRRDLRYERLLIEDVSPPLPPAEGKARGDLRESPLIHTLTHAANLMSQARQHPYTQNTSIAVIFHPFHIYCHTLLLLLIRPGP